jgi:AraC family transcriptional regulator of adaptative response/methylated-DNA-[protein]-cysteine methyltransferase
MTKNKINTSETIADDPRWARIVARDKRADGRFWYSVLYDGRLLPPVLPITRS